MSPWSALLPFPLSCMLSFVSKLVTQSIHPTSLVILVLLPFALFLLISRSLKEPNRAPVKDPKNPPSPRKNIPSNPRRGSPEMPSILYQPPAHVLEDLNVSTSHLNQEQFPDSPEIETACVKQSYDAFLVLDVEATCFQGAGFDWPNEIIEWPVCLLRWKDRFAKGKASRLEIVDEFRSFVKPTWRPQLTQFCTDLTGITQEQVDYAPTFPKVLKMFARFLAQHGLIDPKNGKPLQRFCWCSDGPFDVRDFVVKQCFISNIPMPSWLRGDVLDVRRVVSVWVASGGATGSQQVRAKLGPSHHFRSLNIPQQLRALGIGPFQGRQHCGIDDTRNVARIVIELARRGIRLEPNTSINPNRRWQWMGRPGEILEYCLI